MTSSPFRQCNAWAATSNLVGTPSEFTMYSPNGNSSIDLTTYSGTVTQDASINTFLNGEYYNNPIQLTENSIILIEGLHTLNGDLTPDIPSEDVYHIYLSVI